MPPIDPDRLAHAVSILKAQLASLTYDGFAVAPHITQVEYETWLNAVLQGDDAWHAEEAI
jgi:hypothetical protein